MTLTLTYEDTLSRVKIVANGFGTSAFLVQVERSLDQVSWTSIRCGVDAPVVSGVVTVYDYEFSSDVVNYYRVSAPKDATLGAVGAAAHADNANVNPALPAGLTSGQLLLCRAANRNTAASVSITGGVGAYTTLVNTGNVKLFGKIAAPGETTPTVQPSGGAAGDSVSAQLASFTNVDLNVINFTTQTNATAQNIAYPALTVDANNRFILVNGWKQDDWTSVATLAGMTEIGEPSTTLGNDQGLVWDYRVETTASNIAAGSFTVTGGATAISKASVVSMQISVQTQTASITPSLGAVWIKQIGSPFLNRSFACVTNISSITRDDRTGVFEILNSSFPVAVTDLRASREITFDVITQTTQQHVDFDLILGLGDVVFIHTPAEHPIPTMYAIIKRTEERRPLLGRPCGNDWRIFTLPLREVRAPGSDICGSTVTWQGVINSYATWQAVMNGETSWFDLMQNIGTPADVIVP